MAEMHVNLTPAEAERLVAFVSDVRGADLTQTEVATVLGWALMVRTQARRLDAILRQPAVRAAGPA